MIRYIFFDAGNTLIFPNLRRILASLHAAGFDPAQEQLYAAERAAKRRLDAALKSTDHTVDKNFWSLYYGYLLESLGAPGSLEADLVAATRRSAHWDLVRPGTREVLRTLRNGGLRLGVISNSDGHIAELLQKVGLHEMFESITDSHLAGAEKPDPRIFLRALDTLGARPEESLYVGDVYPLDYLGALGVGMQGLLMDVAGTYREDPWPRIESLEELPPRLYAAASVAH